VGLSIPWRGLVPSGVPRLSAIAVPAVEHIADQLRFAPPEALRRAVERVEELAGEVDEGAEYPADWVMFRVSGYRADRAAGSMSPIRGAALLADLSALAERLSRGAHVSIDEARAQGMAGVDELCERWSVSRKTLDRFRRRGLIARRAEDDRGRASLVFSARVVERFEAGNAARLARGGEFSRIDPDTEERIVRRAARYRRLFDWSISRCAARLAAKFGRSHEAVRALLLRQGNAAGAAPPARTSRDDGRDFLRALSRGVEPRELAGRAGVTARGVIRAAAIARRELLVDLLGSGALDASRSPAFERPDAAEVILAARPVREGLGGHGITDLLGLIRAARPRDPRPPAEERARALAYHFLRFTTAAAIRSLDDQHPGALALDEIETRLRWAARLKAELMRPQLHLVIETVEGLVGPPEELPRGLHSAQVAALVRAAIGGLAEAVDLFEPQRPARGAPGRLAAPAGLAIARACARWMRSSGVESGTPPTGRAASRLLEGVTIPDWTLSCTAWQRWLEPELRVRAGAAGLDAASRELLETRFGWSGGPARTLKEIAAVKRTTLIRATVLERTALRGAWKNSGTEKIGSE